MINNLSTSYLPSISNVTPVISDTNVYLELFLSDIYTNVKTSFYDLKRYIFADSASRNINKKYNIFDIYYVTCNQINAADSWPLILDSSINSLNIKNMTSPNWLNNAYIATIHTSIKITHSSFWNKLQDLILKKAISYEIIPNTNIDIINNSEYMREYNTYGYTGRFLIDETDGFVALPILNDLFIRILNNNNIGQASSDSIKNHLHGADITVFNSAITQVTKRSVQGVTNLNTESIQSTDQLQTTGTETRPNNITMIPVLCVKSDITPIIINIGGKYNKNISIPVGTIFPYSNKTLNNKAFLICDGSYYRITDYSTLFNKIGHTFSNTAYGWSAVPDDSIYFRVPDFRNTYISYTEDSGKLFKKTNTNFNNTRNELLNHYHGIANVNFATVIYKVNHHHHHRYYYIYEHFTHNVYSNIMTWASETPFTLIGASYTSDNGSSATGLSTGNIATTNGIPLNSNTLSSFDTSHTKLNYIIKAK